MYSHSKAQSGVSGFDSFDENDMDDTSGVHKKHIAPTPPNDQMMHISKCANAKCLMRNAWLSMEQERKQQKTPAGGLELDNQFVRFHSCLKCQSATFHYCSQRCRQQDWFRSHQFECAAQVAGARDSVVQSDVERIEASTSFIVEGRDAETMPPEELKVEKMLQVIGKEDFDFEKTRKGNLGKGSFGEVMLATHRRSGLKVALKKVEKFSLKSEKMKQTLIREIQIQKQLNHPYICRLYSSFEDHTTIFLALEYASLGNLFFAIRKQKTLTEEFAFKYFIQACSGIYYMHKQGLIHRDIKPENILIKEGDVVKVCDLGWCVQTDFAEQRNTFCGTLEYMAPEMIQNQPHDHTLDVWALGILLYELLHGRAPFTGSHPRDISEKIMRGVIKFKAGCSKEYKNLVNAILQADASQRLPLIKVFDHPWVKKQEKTCNFNAAVIVSNEESKVDEDKRVLKEAMNHALVKAAQRQRRVEEEAAAKEAERQKKLEEHLLAQQLLKQQKQSDIENQKREEEKRERDNELMQQQKLQQQLEDERENERMEEQRKAEEKARAEEERRREEARLEEERIAEEEKRKEDERKEAAAAAAALASAAMAAEERKRGEEERKQEEEQAQKEKEEKEKAAVVATAAAAATVITAQPSKDKTEQGTSEQNKNEPDPKKRTQPETDTNDVPRETADELEIPTDDAPTIVLPPLKPTSKEDKKHDLKKRKQSNTKPAKPRKSKMKTKESERARDTKAGKTRQSEKPSFKINDSVVIMSNKKAMDTERETKGKTMLGEEIRQAMLMSKAKKEEQVPVVVVAAGQKDSVVRKTASQEKEELDKMEEDFVVENEEGPERPTDGKSAAAEARKTAKESEEKPVIAAVVLPEQEVKEKEESRPESPEQVDETAAERETKQNAPRDKEEEQQQNPQQDDSPQVQNSKHSVNPQDEEEPKDQAEPDPQPTTPSHEEQKTEKPSSSPPTPEPGNSPGQATDPLIDSSPSQETPHMVYSDRNSEEAAEFQDDEMEPNEFLEDFLQQEEDGTLYGDPKQESVVQRKRGKTVDDDFSSSDDEEEEKPSFLKKVGGLFSFF